MRRDSQMMQDINLMRQLKILIPEVSYQRCSQKRFSENMQQIYRRTPMLKCDFNKVTKQLENYYTCSCNQQEHILLFYHISSSVRVIRRKYAHGTRNKTRIKKVRVKLCGVIMRSLLTKTLGELKKVRVRKSSS